MNISDDISINNIQTNIFNGKLRSNISICNLDHNKAIACYRDIDSNDYGKACILDINNNTIISKSEAIFNNGASYWISVDRLTDTKAIVCFRDYGSNGYGTACILNINNNTIIPGNKVVFNNGNSYYISVSCLTNSKAIVCYRDSDNSSYGTASILNIDNNTIIREGNIFFNNAYSSDISVSHLTDTKAIVCYRDYDSNYRGIACILNIDNDTIILKNSVIFNNKNSNHISVNRLTNNKAIICFRNYSDNYRYVCILNTENNNILNKYQIDNETTGEIFIRKIDNSHIIICYNTDNNGVCEIFKIENDKIFSNKYGVIIDYGVQYINYVSEIYNNKLTIIYSRIGKLHSQTIELTHEHI